MSRFLVLFALAGAFLSAPLAAQDFPELSGRVVDAADIIPADVEAELTQKLAALETQSQRQLVVASVPDLQGYDIAEYGYQLGRAWELGDAERDDGILLLVAPKEKRVRIEVAYGLEGIMTDALSTIIINNEVTPRFKQGDYPGGIMAGTDAIIAQLQLPPDQAAQIAAEASQRQTSQAQQGGFPIGSLIWIGFLFFFFILPMFGGRGRRRRMRGGGIGNIILWEVGSAVARGAMSGGDDWGGGGFGGGGFGGGGGGFSGGGGSFGGGGASGGW